ncbi:hypothetical protein [Streptomyces scabiei]|uniref:hypothetical protein n=1 Tax=Streptomyces scabiei TaxID=1930 RepID=UPI0029B3394E|nr:hypothetical protein [Streptomyces scabiei]MDX2802676.1 hypothetical protein [Streptomyces scabiei]MDX3277229.1 hypothetical protein [Streptomyces scabiei]
MRSDKASELLAEVGRELAEARAALAEALHPAAPEEVIDRYTGALFDAVRAWQMEMWGPAYVDPVDGPPPPLAALIPAQPVPLDKNAVRDAIGEIAQREFPPQMGE